MAPLPAASTRTGITRPPGSTPDGRHGRHLHFHPCRIFERSRLSGLQRQSGRRLHVRHHRKPQSGFRRAWRSWSTVQVIAQGHCQESIERDAQGFGVDLRLTFQPLRQSDSRDHGSKMIPCCRHFAVLWGSSPPVRARGEGTAVARPVRRSAPAAPPAVRSTCRRSAQLSCVHCPTPYKRQKREKAFS